MNEETKRHWISIGTMALLFFIVAYLAFYMTLKSHLKRFNNPFYQTQKMEKMLMKQARDFEKFDEKYLNNPFEPRMRPMIVNLVKEGQEYKVIIDLSAFDGDENAINIAINDDELTVSGKMDKKVKRHERIINFTQTYYLDEILEQEKMSKERKGDKYIVTIPFKVSDSTKDDD